MRLRFLAAVALGCALAAPAFADDRAALVGTVFDDEGKGMDGVFVMIFEGEKTAPPFLIRPKAFGLPLPNVKVTTTDEEGRFRFDRVKGGTKTFMLGEEGLLLFGAAAVRYAEFDIDADEGLRFNLTTEEVDAYYTLADRAEESTEVIENVLVEVDMALGWYVETRRKVNELSEQVKAKLGIDEEKDGDGDEDRKKADEDLSSAWKRLRDRIESIVAPED